MAVILCDVLYIKLMYISEAKYIKYKILLPVSIVGFRQVFHST